MPTRKSWPKFEALMLNFKESTREIIHNNGGYWGLAKRVRNEGRDDSDLQDKRNRRPRLTLIHQDREELIKRRHEMD